MKTKFTRFYRSPAVRFLAVGGLNFVVTYAVYLIALLMLDYHIAFTIAFVTGLIFTSVLTIRHTFTVHLTILSAAIYGAYYLLYFSVNICLIEILIEDYAFDAMWAPFLSLVVLTPIHFLLSKVLVASFWHLGDGDSSRIH